LTLLVLTTLVPGSHAADVFELKDGDRVVLIGDTLIERDQQFGYLETVLTAKGPRMNITFRNLGWSGDNVRGASRSGFGPEAEGTRLLKEQVVALKPTVVIVGYGMADSFEGEAGLPRFVEGLTALVDVIEQSGARVVLLSPIAHEDRGRPLPDPTPHNKDLMKYAVAIGEIAKARKAAFVDLFEYTYLNVLARQKDRKLIKPFMTDDGIHLNELGSYALSLFAADGLGARPFERNGGPIVIEDGKVVEARGTTVSGLVATPDGVRFELLDECLPYPLLPPEITNTYFRRFYISGLKPGRYVLKADGHAAVAANAEEWKDSVVVTKGPEFDQVDALRRVINEKNRLYFYRWRPQNETYLFGFRKHEQGNNAREVPLFDPLVEEKEKEIDRLKVPVKHAYELVRETEETR
jgi:lysophospholipase L1-like esterase